MDLETWRKEFIKTAKDLPMSYSRECEERGWKEIGIGPVGRSRDSGPLDLSNFKVISAELQARFPESVCILRFRHWAVGWVEEIAFDATKDPVVEAVVAWGEKLEKYPVADEEHFSATEWEENHPDETSCYAEDREDCPCGTAKREREEKEREEAEEEAGE